MPSHFCKSLDPRKINQSCREAVGYRDFSWASMINHRLHAIFLCMDMKPDGKQIIGAKTHMGLSIYISLADRFVYSYWIGKGAVSSIRFWW
jgi:hypothetical protein